MIISIPALPSGQGNKLREIRELKLVVEGKSEFWDDAGKSTTTVYLPMKQVADEEDDTTPFDSIPRQSIWPMRSPFSSPRVTPSFPAARLSSLPSLSIFVSPVGYHPATVPFSPIPSTASSSNPRSDGQKPLPRYTVKPKLARNVSQPDLSEDKLPSSLTSLLWRRSIPLHIRLSVFIDTDCRPL